MLAIAMLGSALLLAALSAPSSAATSELFGVWVLNNELTTEVHAADSGQLIYTVVSSVSKVETIDEVIDVLGDKIAKRLRRDGVVK